MDEHNDIIVASVHHRAIDGDLLVKAREAMGLSQAQFAQKAGFSQQFQSRIESPGTYDVTTNVAKAVMDVIEKHFTTD